MKVQTLLLPLAALLFLTCAPLAAPRAARTPPAAQVKSAAAMPTRTVAPVLPISKGEDLELRIAVGVKPQGALSFLPPGITANSRAGQTLASLKTDRPVAEIATWVIEPKAGVAIRGTVLFLHGFGTDHHSISNAADALRRGGYRCVMVDMRGFGDSTGTHTDFGPTDAADAREVIDYLQARKLCGPTLGVYGTSLGAATAILLAGEDARISSVVAVAPFADIRTEVPSFARGVLGSAATYLQEDELNKIANSVGRVMQWNLDSARPIDAITQTKAPVLLIHGDADEYIPHAASEQLHAAAPDHSELITPHNRGHLDLCFDFPGELFGVTKQWFDKTLMPH